jgi:hypothetical protein
VDAKRVRPAENTNEVAAGQVEALLDRLPESEGVVPLFVFDAGYDPVQLQRRLTGRRAAILVRLRAGRCFYADPVGSPAKTGRPRRHGPKLDTRDSGTWPTPTAEHHPFGDKRTPLPPLEPAPTPCRHLHYLHRWLLPCPDYGGIYAPGEGRC